MPLLCFCRHFERNVTKWSEVEKSPTIVKMNFLREISPFRFASVEMTSYFFGASKRISHSRSQNI